MKLKKDRLLLDEIFEDLFEKKIEITNYVEYLKSKGFTDD